MDTDHENLFNYILAQPEGFIMNLLSDSDTVRTFIRLLSPLAQHFLFRLLMLPGEWSLTDFRKWCSEGSENESQEAFRQLRDCYLIQINSTLQSDQFYKHEVSLKPKIRKLLLYTKRPVSQGHTQQNSGMPFQLKSQGIFSVKSEPEVLNDEIQYTTEEMLDDWSASQLEKILLWMLKITPEIDEDIRQLLGDSSLVSFDNELTKKGHQFVLADTRTQIWRIVQSYLNSFSKEEELISALRFLLKLGCQQFTRGYLISELDPSQRKLLGPFCSLGLVCSGNGLPRGYYFPTRVCLNFFGKKELNTKEGWILIDTNFKIAAYTSSKLHIELLRKFSIITYEMPGFTSAYISPDSFKNALSNGTTMKDILAFLKANISSLGDGKIPPNVEHQFEVWQGQRTRLITTHDVVMRQYFSLEDADRAAEMAGSLMGFIDRFKVQDMYAIITTKAIEEEFEKKLRSLAMQRDEM